MTISIREKIVLIACAIVFIAIGANTVINGYFFSKEYSDALRSKSVIIGRTLVSQLDRLIKLKIPLEDIIGFEEQCRELVEKHPDISYAMIVAPDGHILFHSDDSLHGGMAPGAVYERSGLRSSGWGGVVTTTSGAFYDYAIPILGLDGERIAYARIGFPVELVRGKTMSLVWYSLGLALIFLSLGILLLVVTLNYWVTNPLARLMSVIRDIRTKGTQSARLIETNSKDEIGQLGATFNQMILEIQASEKRIRQHAVELEAIVRDRTAELEVANRRLENDIEKRKMVEKELRESEEKYRSMMEATNNQVHICSPDYRLSFANAAMMRRIGPDAVGKKCYEALYGLKEKCEWCPQDKIQRGEHASIEVVNPQDGRTYQISSSPIFHENGTISKMTISRDVTELRKMEEELIKAKKLESIGLLAGGMAHDYNNLLAVILGNIELMSDNVRPQDKGLLQDAVKAIFRAKELTGQLITFSMGGAPVKLAASLENLIRRAADRCATGPNLQTTISMSPDLRPVRFDPNQMKHAIDNILINAVESMPSGGAITIRLENLGDEERQGLPLSSGDHVKITIRDTGKGIQSALLPKIFDPYFSTKAMGAQKGMGLGLTTAFSIIKSHGGIITAASKIGFGSLFTIYLPTHDSLGAHPKTGSALQPAAPRHRTQKVLVMDDERMIRALVQKMVPQLGYTVDLAKNGEEAVALYQDAISAGAPFEFVILDLTIKDGLGGKDTMERLMKIDPGARVIVSSGYSNDPIMTNYQEFGFLAALPKPYTKGGLEAVLGHVSD